MIRMSEIVAVVLAGTIAGILTPESKGDGYRRFVRMICGLAVLFVITESVGTAVVRVRTVLPELEEWFSVEWRSGEEIHAQAQEWVIARGIRNVEQGATALVRTRFSQEVSVNAAASTAEDGTVFIESLQILADRDSGADLRAIEEYLENLLSCPCRAEWRNAHVTEGEARS